MMINANTKISSLLKENPDALEAIVSISPTFKKLRNPILRKVMAGRTSIGLASKLGHCSIESFFTKLEPLGFEIDRSTEFVIGKKEEIPVPDFLKNINRENIVKLDVRQVISSGQDPLKLILQEINELRPGNVLNIINSFEPTPLMQLLGKQGFESYSEVISDELVHTYFYKKEEPSLIVDRKETDVEGWYELLKRFDHRLETIDVRNMEMPMPMHAILGALDELPAGKALFVYHKRIPVFLLPELESRQFNYRIREVSDGEIHLLIYKD